MFQACRKILWKFNIISNKIINYNPGLEYTFCILLKYRILSSAELIKPIGINFRKEKMFNNIFVVNKYG